MPIRPRHAAALLLVAAVALTLTACGTSSHTTTAAPSKPKISAAAACADFRKWFLQFPPGTKVAVASKIGLLKRAVSEAPSGQLYQDLSTLEANVETAASTPGSLGQAEENMVVTNVSQVQENDCSSVNPGS